MQMLAEIMSDYFCAITDPLLYHWRFLLHYFIFFFAVFGASCIFQIC